MAGGGTFTSDQQVGHTTSDAQVVPTTQRTRVTYIQAAGVASGGVILKSGGASGTSNYPTKSRYETGSYGYRPLEDFFTWNFTPSSDNTAIRLYFRWHGGFGYRGINVYLKGGNQGHTNDVPSYGWTSGDQNGEWWYNSWGKDVEAEIRFEVHGASHNNTGIDEGLSLIHI